MCRGHCDPGENDLGEAYPHARKVSDVVDILCRRRYDTDCRLLAQS